MVVGIFQRCENRELNLAGNTPKVYSICDQNKYNFDRYNSCSHSISFNGNQTLHRLCHLWQNPCDCDYSSYGKGLMACTIIAVCALGIAFLLLFSHTVTNPYNGKIQFFVTVITTVLLLLGVIFIIITLIILGSTLSYDLYQYRYNLDYKTKGVGEYRVHSNLGCDSSLFVCHSDQTEKDKTRQEVVAKAREEYDTRLDWAAGLEIIALFFATFTLIAQVLYLVSMRRRSRG